MKYQKMAAIAIIAIIIFIPAMLKAHCEIPCGIYDDELRYSLLKEHIGTIEKSMTKISELSESGENNYNQIVRWVTNKEEHADKLIEIVTQYFLTQRIKPVTTENPVELDKYIKHLRYFHEMIVNAMKAKQTVDHDYIAKLRELVEKSEKLYFKK